MTFNHPAHLDALERTHANFGYEPTTYDQFMVPHDDRFKGTYLIGLQGSGKSKLLQKLITDDMNAGQAVIVLDPHPDLILDCLSHVPPNRLANTYLLDVEDTEHPFGLNVFSIGNVHNELQRSQAIERISHMFDVLWDETRTQANMPMFMPYIVKVFLYNPGATLLDMLRFFRDDAFRADMIARVPDPLVHTFWQYEYDSRSDSERRTRVGAFVTRLNTLFADNLARNILAQPKTTVNFKKAIEEKQIIFVRLPRSIEHVSNLIGTIILSQIQDAVFSFGAVPVGQRPSVSLYMDEFQVFATKDIEKLLSQGENSV